MTSIENVYKFRSLMRDLYSRDVYVNGDLTHDICESIQDDHIEKLEIGIREFYIDINFYKETSQEIINDTIFRIKNAVSNFILLNINSLKLEEDEIPLFKTFIGEAAVIFDVIYLGNNVRISL